MSVLVTSVIGGQTITPRFAWPVNTVADIHGESYSIVERDGQRDSTSRRVTSRLEVRAHPNGLLIGSGPTSGPAIAQGGGASGVPMDAYMRTTMRYIVDLNGAFRQFEDSIAVKRQLDSIMQPMVERLQRTSPAMVTTLRATISIASMEAATKQSWDMLLGGTLGRSWSPGDSARTVYAQPAPGSPRINIFSERTTIYRGVVPCPTASGATSCWRFDTRSELDRRGMKESVEKMMAERGMNDPTAAARIPIPSTVTSAQLIVDAATVRPLEVRTTVESATKGAFMAGVNLDYSIRHHTTVSYRWKSLN